MKKFLLLIMVAVGIMSASARNNYSHDINVLPTAAQSEVKNNFKASVSHIKIDKDFGRVSEYDVILTDGSEISFDSKGNWKDIEMRANTSVPSAFVPQQIAEYVSNNHKGTKIVGIEKNKSGYDVELSNGIDMKFTAQGAFKRYDD